MMVYKMLLALAGIGFSVYATLCVWVYFYQTRLIFKPTAGWTETPALPNYEDVWIGADGVSTPGRGLHGWWLPRSQGPLSSLSLTLLYLHGNSENIGSNLGLAQRYQKMGFDVLLVDYRGYGQSQGPFPNEQRVYEDAIATHRYLTETRQVSEQQLWLFGHSLGGAIAIELASRRPAAGLIVQGTFSSMLQAATLAGTYNWLPVNWLLTQRFDSLAKVSQLQLPVFYIHGLEDDTTSPDMSAQLHALSPSPKDLWLVPEAGHNNVASVSGEAYFTQVETFVEQTQRTAPIQPPATPVE